MLFFPNLTLIGLLLGAVTMIGAAAPGTSPAPAVPAAPPWLSRCLPQLRSQALVDGAPLPTDRKTSSDQDHGTCAARCDRRCFLSGDFDGDGRPQELAVATPEELLLFHEVERAPRGPRPRRVQATLRLRLPLGTSPGEVALISAPRAAHFADEVGLLRDGKSPLPTLAKGERLALGLLLWRDPPEDEPESPPPEPGAHEDPPVGGETGELMLAIFDSSAKTYRLQPVLRFGAP